jgi:transcription-repair coupling factor (superfamily II helicase)
VSNLQHLIKQFAQAPRNKQLIKALEVPEARVQLKGMVGAQLTFAFGGVFEVRKGFHLFISNSREEAAFLQNDLAAILTSDQGIHFFPDSFKRPAFFDDINPVNVLQRSETINKTTSPNAESEVIVTYPEALFEKVVSPSVLASSRIEVKVGERLDVDFMVEMLIEYKFERTDFVYEPGQFSLRGGIVDLFSFGNDLPYRIELFDDEVETIRIFDPLSQLSKQNIKTLSIVPNINTRFTQDQKVSLFNVLPQNTVIWVQDFQFLLDRLQFCFDRAEAFASKLTALDDAEIREIFKDRAFLYPNNVIEDVKDHSMVFYG